MKKAEEYIKEFRAEADKFKVLGDIAVMMLHEVADLAKIRKPGNDRQWAAIIEEVDRKWRRFAAQTPEAKPDGLKELIKLKFPDIFEIWMKERQRL